MEFEHTTYKTRVNSKDSLISQTVGSSLSLQPSPSTLHVCASPSRAMTGVQEQTTRGNRIVQKQQKHDFPSPVKQNRPQVIFNLVTGSLVTYSIYLDGAAVHTHVLVSVVEIPVLTPPTQQSRFCLPRFRIQTSEGGRGPGATCLSRRPPPQGHRHKDS